MALIRVVQAANECEGANEIGGKIFGVVKKVGHSSLRIWVSSPLADYLRHGDHRGQTIWVVIVGGASERTE
jgi:hypothetical protein